MDSAEQEKQLAAALKLRLSGIRQMGGTMPSALVGLDGFIDEIVHVVDKREDVDNYSRINTIEQLARRLDTAAGHSANIELVSKVTKIGGNGPIMANALAKLGAGVTYVGNLGYPTLHPVFKPLADRGTVYSLAEPAHTDALEFNDGKLMLGKMDMLKEITWERLIAVLDPGELARILENVGVMALVNWTMIPQMSDIWEKLIEEVCPRISAGKTRYAFFDLADPEKRTREDVRRMLKLIPRFSSKFKVVFGLNERESRQIAAALGMHERTLNDQFVGEICRFIASELEIHCVMVHPIKYAVATSEGKNYHQDGPTTTKPIITTGAGDHLNAAFCMGLSLGMDIQTCLLMGVCCSGFYVINGRSPDIAELNDFMADWRNGNEERNKE